jgi:hypothetical protein
LQLVVVSVITSGSRTISFGISCWLPECITWVEREREVYSTISSEAFWRFSGSL